MGDLGISVSQSNPTPLYQQIVKQIKAKILAGELEPGDTLPSIRQLAEELLASVITTKRAYAELEAEGLIVTRPGLGTFVAGLTPERVAGIKCDVVRAHLGEAVRTAREIGLADGDVRKMLEELFREVSGGVRRE